MKIKMGKNPIGSPKKIIKRGIYESINIMTGKQVKPRNYGKRVGV